MKWIDMGYTFPNQEKTKVARYQGSNDIRTYKLKGWKTTAELLDIHPVTGKRLNQSAWFIWAIK